MLTHILTRLNAYFICIFLTIILVFNAFFIHIMPLNGQSKIPTNIYLFFDVLSGQCLVAMATAMMEKEENNKKVRRRR